MATHIFWLHGKQKQKKSDFLNFEIFQLEGLLLQNFSAPFINEKELFLLQGSWYSNRPAQSHGFNAKIGDEKYAPRPKISAKMCQILMVCFGMPILDSFFVITCDSARIFQNPFFQYGRVGGQKFMPPENNSINHPLRKKMEGLSKKYSILLPKPWYMEP